MTAGASTWHRLIAFLSGHHRFQVTTHVHPDGDAVGAQVGLALFLVELGKSTLLVNEDPVPRIYRFLDPEGRVRTYEPGRDDPDIAACDAAIIVDVASLERVGRPGAAARRHNLPFACIDHHVTNDGIGDVSVVRPDAASTASLVLDLIRAMGRKPSPRVAEALYVGLATDTGWFRFANATPEAFRDAAELVASGAQPPRIYELVYENLSWPRTRLLARALATLASDAGGRIAYLTITRAMFAETGATDDEVEGFVDKLRELGGVEVIIMFRETPQGGTKVSLRAKHDADVASLAERFGGGGHRRAAGIDLKAPLEAVVPLMLAAARELLNA